MSMRFIRKYGIRTFLIMGLCAGVTVPQSFAQNGPTTIRETYGGWAVMCRQASDLMQCNMMFEARQQDSQQLILRVSLSRAQDGPGADATILTPFGVSVTDGLEIAVNEGEPLVFASFRTCIAAGCVVRTPVGEDVLQTIANAEQFQVVMQQLDDGGALNIVMPTDGFESAWQRLFELREEG